MNSKVVSLIAIAVVTQAPCLASDILSGHVEHRNSMTRLTRPAMPSKPLGDALDHAGKHGVKQRKSSFEMAGSSVANILDKGSFDFNLKSGAQDSSAEKPKLASKIGEEGDKKLQIEWEEWHKRVQGTIYQVWQNFGNVPGEASVVITVSKSGNIDFKMTNFRVDMDEQFSNRQDQLFESCISQTINSITHSNVLQFPSGSKRTEVSLTTRIALTGLDGAEEGYSWKKNDVETVTAPR